MNYQQQLEVVQNLLIQYDSEIRIDCPFCSHKNTFVVKNDDGTLYWYCFHASCSAKGKQENKLSMQKVYKTFNTEEVKESDKFILPDSFKSIHSNTKALDYLHKNNCWEAMSWGRAEFRYDVRQDRVVFLIKDYDNTRGAIGRGLNSRVYPKWYIYGSKDYPFICGQGEDVVLVEDCASACAVSNVMVGMALMGTSYQDKFTPHIPKYRNLYVALDRDATKKSYDIANYLRSIGFDNVKVKMLEDDLKYYSTDKIRKVFYD